MTLMETLKQLFGSKLDEEVDTTIEETKEDTEDETTKKSEDPKKTKEDNKSKKEIKQEELVTTNDKKEGKEDSEGGESVGIFTDGWYNKDNKSIDFSKISNPEVVSAIQMLQGTYEAERSARLINEAINTELSNYSLNVSKESLLKMLDTTDVKLNKDGQAVGIKDAIEKLQKAEPTLFKDKAKESNPLNEGFNPVQKTNTGNVNSFEEAFRLMDEIN